jgi:Protein of unknown function (DUF1552)
MKTALTRRTVLRAGSLSLALPLLESLGCRSSSALDDRRTRSQALTFPKRLVFFFTPQGNLELPSSMDFTGSMLAPLQKFREKMVVLKGLDMASQDVGPGEPHQQGMAALTGRRLLDDGMFLGGCGNLRAGWASGISVDQHIAAELGRKIRFKLPTLNLGVQTTAYGGTEVRTIMSYRGAKDPVKNEVSPWEVYNRVFAGIGKDPAEVQRQLKQRTSVLDFAKGQLQRVTPKVGLEDKLKLEAHLQKVTELEAQLAAPDATLGGSCKKLDVGAPVAEQYLNLPENYPRIGALQMDLAAMALACDLTRVVTLQWSAGTNNKPYPFLSHNGAPITGDEHVMGHQPDSDVETWAKLRVIREWYMTQLASLLQRLDDVPEGSGTMLDNTVVVWLSDVTRGNTHSHKDMPFLLCGGAGGAWTTNRILSYDNMPHNNLLVSLMNMMGVEGTTFGDPDYCSGPLPMLV